MFLGKVAGRLRQRLGFGHSDADGKSRMLQNTPMQVFAPLLQFVKTHVG